MWIKRSEFEEMRRKMCDLQREAMSLQCRTANLRNDLNQLRGELATQTRVAHDPVTHQDAYVAQAFEAILEYLGVKVKFHRERPARIELGAK